MDKPFVGLVPFAERDAAYFFGRQSERRVLVDNLLASRLTLLYGESGAGKSSLLNAGVVSELRPAPEFVVVVFRSWREDPLLGLAESIQKATGTVVLNTTKAGLCEVIKTCTAPRIAAEVVSPAASLVGNGKGTDNPTEREERRTLLIILDQFEEYFHYHPGIDSFDKELARALGARDVPANFLISVREDWLAALDRFKGRIPGLFDNYLRMQHLSRKGATEAIEGPLQTFNQLHKNGDSVSWDEDLTERVINSILSSQSTLERGLQSEDRVQAPYLQMVMSTLWRREQELNSRRLRVKTLEDDLKGARHIYESHFATTLNKELTDEERKVAPAIFACFVTGTGRKQNQTVHDVSANTGIPEALVGGMVGKLRNALVLTQTPPPKGAGRDEVGYEFAHDVLAEAALKYVRQEAVEAERRKAEDAEKRAIAEAQAARRLRFLLGGLVALLIIAAAAVGVAWVQAKRAETERKKALILQDAAYQARGQAVKNETKALAEAVVSAADSANLRYEFDLAVLLASYARHHSEDFPDVAANAEAVLRSALMSVDAQELHGVEDIMLNTIAWSPDSTRLAGADEDSVYVWDLRKKFPFKDDLSGADAVAWSADGKWLAESDGSLRDGKTAEYLNSLGDGGSGRGGHLGGPHGLVWHPTLDRVAMAFERELQIWQLPEKKKIAGWEIDAPIDQLAWSPDGTRIAVTTETGDVEVWDAESHRRLLSAKVYKSGFDKSGEAADIRSPHLLWRPDGQRLLITDVYKSVDIRDAVTGKAVTHIDNKFIAYPGWSHDSQWLALVIFGSPSIKILDSNGASTYLQLASPDPLTILSWSSDDKLLAAATLTKFIRIYNTDALRAKSKELFELARRKVKRDLTPQECAQYLQMQTCPPRP